MKEVEISFSYYFDDKEISQLEGLKIGKYILKVNKLEKPSPETGGIGWQGIIIFISAAIITGFLQEIGKDIHSSFKRKLFGFYKKLKKKGPEYFTINIQLDKSFMAIYLSPSSYEDLVSLLRSLSKEFGELKIFSEKNRGWYRVKFDTKTQRWIIIRSNI